MKVKTTVSFVADDGKEFKTAAECKLYEQECRKRVEEENRKAEDKFFDLIGVNKKDVLKNNWFVIVDRFGNFVRVDKRDYDEIRNDNIKDDTFGHNLSAFTGRNEAWYKLPLIEKFENLCWKTTVIDNQKVLCDGWGIDKLKEYLGVRPNGVGFKFYAKNKTDARMIIKCFNGYSLIL